VIVKFLSRRERETWVQTMDKIKSKKVHPKNVPLIDGAAPGGGLNLGLKPWKTGDDLVGQGSGLVMERGSRLTKERLASMKIGNGFLTDAERQLFVDILFADEGTVVFDDSEIGQFNPVIELPIEIRTVPHHDPWQQTNL
jgi:hypothetical protein